MTKSINLSHTFFGSEIVVARHTTNITLDIIRNRVRSHFPAPATDYSAMSIGDYREIVQACQDVLNQEAFLQKIVSEIYGILINYLDNDTFLCQSNLYLRATRPNVSQATEAIGWHRETFYGANMERSINVWTPIDGVTESNTLRFIPMSQKIPEHEILTEQEDDPVTKKGSIGNKLGFLYAPKRIVSGVDLSKAAPMNVPEYHSALFPGNLIHGAGVNSGDQIRFSIDFRVIPKRFYNRTFNKQIHGASGKPYFEDYQGVAR